MASRFIVIWRQSATSRGFDVQLDDRNEIAVFPADSASGHIIADEDELIRYINGGETREVRVDADLAHRVLGWTIS